MEIQKITIHDSRYPALLKEIPDPPRMLYFRGTPPQPAESCVAVVGTRRCSDYGKQVTYDIAGNLAAAGVTIVSGLAPGIDTWAHTATLERMGRTIAVIGAGIDEKSIYPQENIQLARDIVAAGGCVLSEYPPGTGGAKFTFPQRNRIISGLALGTLVIEAAEKSGSLITANYAFEHKRKVFAVPGPVYAPTARGPHVLIKRGASLIDSSDDIMKQLELVPCATASTKGIAGNTPEESRVLQALEQEALSLDAVVEKTSLPAADVARIITVLELEEKVKNLGGNVYALVRQRNI